MKSAKSLISLLVRINLLLTEREGRIGEYWTNCKVLTVRTERSVQKLLRANIPLELAFENKKCSAYDRCNGNGPHGKIPTKKELIRTSLPQDHLAI